MEKRIVNNEDEDLFRSIDHTSKGFYIAIFILMAVIGFAAYTYLHQILAGLGVTGLAQPVSWGFYIVNFVFSSALVMQAH